MITKENQNTVPIRPVSKSGNFSIRESKANTDKLPAHDVIQKKSLNSCSIQFDSNFESGNLFRAYQKSFNEFDLILQNDINSKGNTQWFFFSIKGVPKNTTLKINIVNMSKS